MTIEQAISSLTSLSTADQQRVVSAIWDNLPDDLSYFMPDSEKQILDARMAKYLANPTNVITEEELKIELRNRRKK